MALTTPYLMFLGDAPDQLAAKTASGVVYWRPEICLGQLKLDGCNADLGLEDMTLEEAADAGCKTLVVGVANRGGLISELWIETIVRAIELGMNVASGLHHKIADVREIIAAAEKHGAELTDARHPTRSFAVASGKKRAGRRLLTVGTDCSVGKMYAALAIEREMKARGMKATFRATGQTGIFIVGEGVSVDAVVADFISGATEWLCPENDADHWDVIEGQGSLFHASYAGVSMGLLHGAQADTLIMCHEPTRTHMRGLPDYPLPDLGACIRANEEAARLTNPDAVCVGIAVNTHALAPNEAELFLKETEDKHGLPTIDPVTTGVAPIVDRLV